MMVSVLFFFFSSRRRHTRLQGDWSSDVCSSDLTTGTPAAMHAWITRAPGSLMPGVPASLTSAMDWPARSEEHTSELQSPCNLVCRLLLEKKKQKKRTGHRNRQLSPTQQCTTRLH